MRNGSTAEKIRTVVEQFGLFVVNEPLFYSQSLVDRMQVYLAKREAGRKAGIASGAARRAKAERALNEPSTSKVKESKVKESIDIERTTQRGAESTQLPLSNDLTSAAAQEKTFAYFWDHYHKLTGKAKSDRAASLKLWKHKDMKLPDQRAAYTGVKFFIQWALQEYSEPKYIPKARTYLADRLWEDDHSILSKKKDPTKTYVQ
jgi:hypothetical protein